MRDGLASGAALSADEVNYDTGHSDEVKRLIARRIPETIDTLIATHNEVCDVAEGLKDRYIMSKEQKDQQLLYENLAKDAILQSLKKVTNSIADLTVSFDRVFDEQLARTDALSCQTETIHTKIAITKEAVNVAAINGYKLTSKRVAEPVSSSGSNNEGSSSIALALVAAYENGYLGLLPKNVRFGSGEGGVDTTLTVGVRESAAESQALPTQEEAYAKIVRRSVDERLRAFSSRYRAEE